jgi:hypothetical protein
MTRSYSELMEIDDYEERFRYLALRSKVGIATFGYERHLNQRFYTSREWRTLRDHVIVRDNGCDLAHPEWPIRRTPIIHHMNPITVDQVTHGDEGILDPEFLITTTLRTHNAIHYGDERQLLRPLIPRRAGDTKLW